MNKKSFLIFLFLGILFILLRLGVLMNSFERVWHYDELDLGTVAKELQKPLHLPFWSYQLDCYSGDSLVLSRMVKLFFHIFGENIFAIKMVPLAFSLTSLTLLFWFLRRFFDEKTAVKTVLLLIFCFPSFTQL